MSFKGVITKERSADSTVGSAAMTVKGGNDSDNGCYRYSVCLYVNEISLQTYP